MKDMFATTVANSLHMSSAYCLTDRFAKSRIRSVCKDRHPSNHAAERLLCGGKLHDTTWDGVEIDCESHMNQTTHKDAAKIVKPIISGMLHVAKSFDTVGDWIDFRQAAQDVILRKNINIRRGESSIEHMVYRQLVLRCCIPNVRGANQKRAVFLTMLPNGNWQDHDNIDIWIPFGVDIGDEDEFKRGIALRMANCLFMNKWKLFTLRESPPAHPKTATFAKHTDCRDLWVSFVCLSMEGREKDGRRRGGGGGRVRSKRETHR